MAEDQPSSGLEALLAEMPRIAEAVNAFTSEAVQQQAFEALLAAQSASTSSRGGAGRGGGAGAGAKPKTRKAKSKSSASAGSNGAKAKRKTSSSSPSLVKDLDLAPKSKQSLRAFAEEKLPKSNHDRNVVSVYYLSQVADISPVTIDHVFTCYRDMSWPLPSSLENSLATTASRKRFLNTSDMADLKLTPPGINHAEHGLPAKSKTKS